jgi:hypothetical protein
MQALVVVESWFGNTRAVAEAVAAALSATMAVDVVGVEDAPTTLPSGLDLLVVGCPTHAFGLSRPATRQAAAQRSGHGATPPRRGAREWLAVLRRPGTAVRAVAFDTRVKKPFVPGSAARAVTQVLRRLGLRMAARPESFWVLDTPGPLRDGEIDRARVWALQLSAQVGARSAPLGAAR